MSEVFWNRMTAEELRTKAAANAIVLLPVASTEQHGPHLATGVDTFLVTEGCKRVAHKVSANTPCIVAPTVWMGLAEHHVALGGTFTLSLRTYHVLLEDLCRSILRAGFKKILIVNGHGGNIAALAALTTDLAKDLDAPISTTTLYAPAQNAGLFDPVLEDQVGVQHACEAETSMMLSVHPDCVRTARIKDAFNPKGVERLRQIGVHNAPLALWRSFEEITPTGVMGDARKATAAKGETLMELSVDAIVAELIAGRPWK